METRIQPVLGILRAIPRAVKFLPLRTYELPDGKWEQYELVNC